MLKHMKLYPDIKMAFRDFRYFGWIRCYRKGIDAIWDNGKMDQRYCMASIGGRLA